VDDAHTKQPVGAAVTNRRVVGALGGSRILAHPEVAAELATLTRRLLEERPVLLEVGFDHGRRLTSTALANPDWCVIGLEVRKRRVRDARKWAEREGLENLHAFRLDARAVFAGALPEGRCDVVEALFPTPWPEGRPRRRLLVTPEFVRDAAVALKPGGLLHVATDVAWYGELIDEALDGEPLLQKVAWEDAASLRPQCPQLSRREWRCARDGVPVYRFGAIRLE